MIIISVLWIGSEITLAITKRSSSTDLRSDKSSLHILWVTIAVAVNSGILISFLHIGYFGNGSQLFPITALVLITSGLIIRWFAIFSLKRQFTVDISIKKNHHINREGIYRFLRHPAYTGSLLSFFGLGLFFTDYISMLIIFFPIFFAFIYRIHIEEKILIDYFGQEYITYCESTKRFIPGIF